MHRARHLGFLIAFAAGLAACGLPGGDLSTAGKQSPLNDWTLENNIAREGLHGTASVSVVYGFTVPENAVNLTVSTAGGDGQVSVYVRLNGLPSPDENDCASEDGLTEQKCVIPFPSPGAYRVMLRSDSSYEGVTLVMHYEIGALSTSAGGGAGGGGGGGGGDGAGGGSGAGGGGGTASTGAVGPNGGTVQLLHFGVTGDTRPPACGDTAEYPTAVIQSVAQHIAGRGAQFAMDLGDHMYVCNNDLATATAQMNLYQNATSHFPGTWFMTEGNHECYGTPCLLTSKNANYVAFMSALSKVSSKPWYSFNVQTQNGLATFVVVADNSWEPAQATWLEQTLTTADQNARYTIVLRHHPEGDTSVSTNADSMQIIRAHKFSLLLTGHSHQYKHMTTDNGRDLVIGIGGAPLVSGGTFNGYAMIDETPSGSLQISVYDLNGDTLRDRFVVGPN